MPSKLAPGIRLRRPGYYEIRVYAGVDPLTGRSRYVTANVRGSIKAANAKRADLLNQVERGQRVHTGRHTLGELFDAVLEHLEALGREPTTLQGYRSIAKRTLNELGDKPLGRLKSSDLDRLYAKIVRNGASASTARRHHMFIHRALAQGVKWEWVSENVSDRASPPTEPRRQMKLVTSESVVRLLEVAEQSRQPELAVAFRLLASMGGRRGEVCGLQWPDVDFDTGVLTIRRAVKQVVGQPLIIGDAKTHQQRSVLLDPTTLSVLNAHRSTMERRAELCGTTLVADAFVLTDEPDGSKPWKPERVSQALARLKKRAGYTGRLHDLRHWHASLLLNAGEPPVVVAERLGHRDASTTHRFYAHAMPRSDRRSAELMNDALPPTRPAEPPDAAKSNTQRATEKPGGAKRRSKP